jgi:hypothetical protein
MSIVMVRTYMPSAAAKAYTSATAKSRWQPIRSRRAEMTIRWREVVAYSPAGELSLGEQNDTHQLPPRLRLASDSSRSFVGLASVFSMKDADVGNGVRVLRLKPGEARRRVHFLPTVC